ncbi:MAG: HAMP domain-containing histidine kinase [Kutzneria sp.]|nr:HAMP domain-containing histidine kinase [Kutzneria sp.]
MLAETTLTDGERPRGVAGRSDRAASGRLGRIGLGRLKPRSLRGRLLLGVLAVTAAGLLTADLVGVMALSSYLDKRTDQQIVDALATSMAHIGADGRIQGKGPTDDLCSDMVIDAAGTVVQRLGNVTDVPIPDVSRLRELAATSAPTTINGNRPFRVAVGALPGGQFVMVSQVLTWSYATVYQLVAIEAVVTLLALALAAVLSLRFSRYLMRPVDQMTDTAGLIADGELSHRVEVDGSPTEVARLGTSLNQMLGRIEHSFAERQLAEERLRRFIADASHELRTPLTSVTGYAQLVRRGALTDLDQLADAMRRVEGEAKRMSALVDELLLLARLDQGRPLTQAPVDLVELALGAVANARAAAPGRTVRMVAEPGPHVVRGDTVRLHQVLTNLLGNVHAHTPPGTAAELRLSRVGGHEVIDVIDDGPGIPPEQHERVFERFFRGDSSRARSSGSTHENTGLGLSIVSAIASAHGGGASVHPSGRGAWLRVVLPAAGPLAPAEDEKADSRRLPSQL